MNFLYHPDTVFTPSDLEFLAEDLLTEIPIPGVEDCGFDSGVIRRTLLQAAVDQTSIKAVTEVTRGTYSDDYTLAQLRIICLDFVNIHYHGCPHRSPSKLCHTTPCDGTSQCHRYLSGFVLCRAKPLVTAVTAVRGDELKSDAVEQLLDHVETLPFDVAGFLYDRGFYNRTCILRLRETAPVIRRGQRMAEKLETSISYWTEYAMYEGSERELRFPLAVCVSYRQDKRGKHGLLVRAYTTYDLADRTPKEVKALCRKLSAIETAFRTMREARARATTADPVVRLVFVLVSFPLRNLWLIVRWGVLATPRRGGRALPAWFRFELFRAWIDHTLNGLLRRKWEAPTNGVRIPATYGQLDAG